MIKNVMGISGNIVIVYYCRLGEGVKAVLATGVAVSLASVG